MKKLTVIVVFVIALVSFTTITNDLFVIPKGWQKPEYDFLQNPLSKEKIALGKALFYDPILSKDNTISCASCHLSYTELPIPTTPLAMVLITVLAYAMLLPYLIWHGAKILCGMVVFII